jgi:hypothetical protein
MPARPANDSWLKFFWVRSSLISSPKLRNIDLERTRQDSIFRQNTV